MKTSPPSQGTLYKILSITRNVHNLLLTQMCTHLSTGLHSPDLICILFCLLDFTVQIGRVGRGLWATLGLLICLLNCYCFVYYFPWFKLLEGIHGKMHTKCTLCVYCNFTLKLLEVHSFCTVFLLDVYFISTLNSSKSKVCSGPDISFIYCFL